MSYLRKWFLPNLPVFMFFVISSSFVYSVYQMQVSQSNQTKRSAGFMMMKELNGLQLLIDKQHYVLSTKAAYIDGWSNILLIDDMGFYFEKTSQKEIETLHILWKSRFN